MAGSGSWQLSAEASSARGCGQCLVSASSEPKEAAEQSFSSCVLSSLGRPLVDNPMRLRVGIAWGERARGKKLKS